MLNNNLVLASLLVLMVCLLVVPPHRTQCAEVKFKMRTIVESLTYPTTVNVFENGDIYVAEQSVVSKIFNNGTKVVIAGGGSDTSSGVTIPTQAQLTEPYIWVDETSRKIYIGEYNGNIRVLDEITNTITTLKTGVGIVKFLILDKKNNQLVFALYRILGGGDIGWLSLVSNNFYKTEIFTKPVGVAISSTDLYFSTLQCIGKPGPYGGSSTGACFIRDLSSPMGIFRTSKNDLYIAEATGGVKVYNGTVRQIAGVGPSGPSCPDDSDALTCFISNTHGIFVTGKNEVYITEKTASGTVRKIYPYCDEGFVLSSDGRSCIPLCFTKVGNESCGGTLHGSCIDVDTCQCSSNYYGIACEIPKCFGKQSTSCSMNGQCVDVNNCSCSSNYYGIECNVTTCDGIFSNNSNSCSNHGTCVDYNICNCNENYEGKFCNISKCNGTISNDPSACSGNGICIEYDTCQCFNSSKYSGRFCEIPVCYGILANQSLSVCSGQGECKSVDNCQCSSKYGGSQCEIPICNTKLGSDPFVCSGKGNCSTPEHCQCNNGYGGSQCELINCFGFYSNQINQICNQGNGTCVAPDTCSCNSGWSGLNCEIPLCNGILANNSKVCSSYGQCTNPNYCKCYSNYYGVNCEKTTCNSVPSDDSNVCFGNGKCLSYDNCNCYDGYGPSTTCQFPICFGKLANDSSVCNDTEKFCNSPNDCKPKNPICFGVEKIDNRSCSGNGICSSNDYCKCDFNYFGEQCQYFKCNGVEFNSTTVCSSHGECKLVNSCICDYGYGGNNCELVKCYEILESSSSVCSGKGKCINMDQCECENGYNGSFCQFKFLSQSMKLSFNNTSDYLGDISTILTLSIQDYLFLDYYVNKSIDIVIEYRLDGELVSSSNVYLKLTSSIPFNLPNNLSKIGYLTARVVLSLNSTLISYQVETETALSLKNRPKVSAELSSIPFLAIESVHNDNTQVIVAAVVVPVVGVGLIGAAIAVVVVIVVMMKKKASASLAKDFIMAGATDVELA